MKLQQKMGDTTKQVRVDNWAAYFLQRLQMFFSKTDYCDMTLQFEGNVQLKVHRLVMNACTEYFQFLEQTCAIEDNVIMMPADLQADVIVPIVNFMYTGMLEFQLSIFDRLYKTAQIMNITILTKLLDAQKHSVGGKGFRKRQTDSPLSHNLQAKKNATRAAHSSDLPAPLPGRKLPVWKRKNAPSSAPPKSHGVSTLVSESKWSTPTMDPLSLPDNTPKPTRFEWPDDDLPPINMMESSFEDISYTSRPLLTLQEDQRASTSFDDVKHTPNASRSGISGRKNDAAIDIDDVKDYVKEQKIRSDFSHESEEAVDDDLEMMGQGVKRKGEPKMKCQVKKVRFEDKGGATISITSDGKASTDLNHEKIVSEILKKYPQLVKKNKNIKLKVMTKNPEQTKAISSNIRSSKLKLQEIPKPDHLKTTKARNDLVKVGDKNIWKCEKCPTNDGHLEFGLYYLYKKHMTDVHSEKFDPKLCKYCGHRCNKHNLLMYHLYTKHGMRPPPAYTFPKCDHCPYIALSAAILERHKLRHGKNEMQCVECKLAFNSLHSLTSHMQITGHTGKTNKTNFDCQYCTKRVQSGVNLFSHVKSEHRNEAIRDGIVSIDEVDDVEELEDEIDEDLEDNSKDEYILPEIIEPATPKKVNILSNVKVQDPRLDQIQRHHHQQIALEPSSEAEALNNVASGIATSLGLVDIVVLNDNQQLFLQSSNQVVDNYNDQSDQAEFILPELTDRETYGQQQTTDGVLTQQMLDSGDIGSTDELVMVLTDHDYGDNQEEINSENSNIVVLYSHPVDGQQDQFITSQGNLMVNSQTGLIEIHNGTTVTSTGNQVVMTSSDTHNNVMTTTDSHIESIEMIQKEIECGGLKQECIEEDRKPVVVEEEQNENLETHQNEEQQSEVNDEAQQENSEERESEEEPIKRSSHPDDLIQSLTQGDEVEFTSRNEETPQNTEKVEDTTENEAKTIEEESNNETERIVDEENTQKDVPIEDNAQVEENIDEIEKLREEEQIDETSSEETQLAMSEEIPGNNQNQEQTEEKPPSPQQENEELPPELEKENGLEDETEKIEDPKEENEMDPPILEAERPDEEEIHQESVNNTQNNENVNIGEDTSEIVEEKSEQEQEKNDFTHADLSQSDVSTSQDENSESCKEDSKENEKDVQITKIAILDDWDDTDSQQSDHREREKVAEETVGKLIDDWEDEEDDNIDDRHKE